MTLTPDQKDAIESDKYRLLTINALNHFVKHLQNILSDDYNNKFKRNAPNLVLEELEELKEKCGELLKIYQMNQSEKRVNNLKQHHIPIIRISVTQYEIDLRTTLDKLKEYPINQKLLKEELEEIQKIIAVF